MAAACVERDHSLLGISLVRLLERGGEVGRVAGFEIQDKNKGEFSRLCIAFDVGEFVGRVKGGG